MTRSMFLRPLTGLLVATLFATQLFSSVAIATAGMADLTASNLLITDAGAGTFSVVVDYSNLGDTAVDPALESHNTLYVNDVVIASYNWTTLSDTSFLAAFGSLSGVIAAPAPIELSDGDVVKVCIDSDDLALESDEENNCVSETLATELPDLTVSSVTFNSSDNSLDFVVDNNGTGEVPSTVDPELAFYYDFLNSDLSTSSSTTYKIDDYGTDYRAVSGTTTINTGSSETEFPTCDLYVLVVVDSTGDVTESDDSNNEYRATFDLCSSTETTTPTTTTSSTGVGSTGSNGGGSIRFNTQTTSDDGSSTDVSGSEDVVLTSEEEAACGTNTFVDVAIDNPYYDAIQQLWCDGVIHGRDSGHFVPSDKIKRDEATKVVARLYGFVTTSNATLPVVEASSYEDMLTTDPLIYYVQTMSDLGYFDAEKALNLFRPDEDMTPSELEALLSGVTGTSVVLEELSGQRTIARDQFMQVMLDQFEL